MILCIVRPFGSCSGKKKDPIEIIKWQEIYDRLEKALDTCESIADAVEGGGHEICLILFLIMVIAAALIFEFINGFHDTANAIATSGVYPRSYGETGHYFGSDYELCRRFGQRKSGNDHFQRSCQCGT